MGDESILLLVSGVAVAGVVGQWLGWRLSVPAIIPLLVFGLLVGPVSGLVQPTAILGQVMKPAIGFAVAIIVFEGGLNLNLRELRSAGSGVLRLIAVALPLNWLFGTLAGHWLGGLSWRLALLFGAILVVTGPTVILPMLRQAKLEPRTASFLKWEAIVNDPIGATLALLVLSYLTLPLASGDGHAALWLAARTLAGAGLAAVLGIACPFAIRWMFRRDLVPEYLKTPMLLSSAIGIYAAGEAFQPETGLIGATLFGVVLANIDITGLQELRRFKESLTVFLVSGLFILLTANIDRAVLLSLSWPILLTTLAVMAVVRPLAIWLATTGASMTPRERLVISWIGPRGVVAAAMAGIAGDRLVAAGYADGALILPMVFAVIAASVLLHGATLAPLARALGLASGGHGGLLIVGASSFTVALGEALRAAGVPVVIADRTQSELRQARLAGLQTLRMEVLSELGEEILDLRDTEQLLAASPDDAYNALVCTRFGPELGRERVHQIAAETDDERQATSREWRGKIAIAPDLSYQRLAALMESGAGLVTEIIKAKDDSAVSIDPGVSWPIAIITRSGALTLVSPEQDNVSASGDLLIRLYLPALTPSPKAAGPPRWAAWRAAFHSRRIRRDPTV